MLARLRKSADENEQGFTLIELLVVMIIIGILAAIAVPVFLSQRQKARDTATKNDVSTVGKEIAAYYVDGTDKLTGTVDTTAKTLTLATSTAPITTLATIKLSDGTKSATGAANAIGYVTPACTTNAAGWYVWLTNDDGSSTKSFSYSAAGGLKATTAAPTSCS